MSGGPSTRPAELRTAIVGPGRVGAALGRRLAGGGVPLLGLLGRDPGRTGEAVRFVGAGRILEWEDLRRAAVVIVATGDDAVTEVAATAAGRGVVAPDGLWLHTSGRHGLGVLDAVAAAGAVTGSLHPLCPFPDRETGFHRLAGQPAVVTGDGRARPVLEILARCAGLRPVWMEGGDRGLYHAACALAANGTTALCDVAAAAMVRAGLPRERVGELVGALAEAVGASVRELGAADALSGPVVRGDGETLRAHLRALRDPEEVVDEDEEDDDEGLAPSLYRMLMVQAVHLAWRRRAIDLRRARALLTILGEEGDG